MRTRSALLAALLLTACGTAEPAAPAASGSSPASASTSAAPASTSSAPAPPEEFTLVATGDVLVHQDRALTTGARQADGSHDFTDVFSGIAPVIEAADLAICHLETPVAPPGGPYRG